MRPYRNFFFLPLAVTLVLAFVARGEAQSFTLEQVMSSPFPSELIVARRGDRVAWVFYAQGKRNIWITEAPAFASRQLTTVDSDDGQDVAAPVFSPRSNPLACVRGA